MNTEQIRKTGTGEKFVIYTPAAVSFGDAEMDSLCSP